jgi:hypothetical protein
VGVVGFLYVGGTIGLPGTGGRFRLLTDGLGTNVLVEAEAASEAMLAGLGKGRAEVRDTVSGCGGRALRIVPTTC